MKNPLRIVVYSLLIVAISLVSAMAATPAFADETTPPPTETPVVEETSTPTEPPVATEIAVTEVPTEVVPPPATEETPPVVEEPVAELLAEIPEGTDLVVLDENGDALALVSEEAAEAIATLDPKWCPVGVAPTSLSCKGPYVNLQAMLADLGIGFNPSTNGIIWIQGGNYISAGAIVFDGSIAKFETWDDFSLELKGGWNGLTSATSPATPSILNDSLSIINWLGNVTLSDIVVQNGLASGLTISTTKNIKLTRVQANNNTNYGANLTNTGAAVTVLVEASEFNGNDWAGLVIFSSGAITLKDITATLNLGDGAYMDNGGNLTLSGTNIFSENDYNGIEAYSDGAILASNVIANSNTDWGAIFDNSAAPGAKPVTLTGSSEFKFNGGGLWVESAGAITLNNITARNNDSWEGARLVNIASLVNSNVTVTGTNVFNDNWFSGLLISSDGAISLNNVWAGGNGGDDGINPPYGFGAELYNDSAGLAKPVTLSGTNLFDWNYTGGLWIDATGAVTLNKVTAVNTRNGMGAVVNNTALGKLLPQNVLMTSYATFDSNDLGGLQVSSYGTITISNLSASHNRGGIGADLNNWQPATDAAITPRAVTLTGNNTFEGNTGDGLRIRSIGIITINNVIANDNDGNGAYLDNWWTGAVGGVSVLNTSTYFPSFSGNGYNGLLVYSKGNILVKDLDALGNGWQNDGIEGGDGVYLDNSFAGSLANVTLGTARLNWVNGLGNNWQEGLEIHSNGTITTYNLDVENNGAHGAWLDNCNWDSGLGACTTVTPKAITLLGSNYFYSNDYDGLFAESMGAITLNNVFSEYNLGYGVYLDNQYDGAVGGVSVLNTSTFSPGFAYNGATGLAIYSKGNIIVKDLDSYGNGQYGVYLDNASGGGTGNVSLGTSRLNWVNGLNDNYYSGLEIFSNGSVTLSNIRANGNGFHEITEPFPYGYGAYIKNDWAPTPKPVTILGTNQFNDNYSAGLWVYSDGAILANRVTANGNVMSTGAALINNMDNLHPQNVTLNGYGEFYGNFGPGLQVQSFGIVTLNNLYAELNEGDGISVDNYTGALISLPRAVILKGYVNTYDNSSYGLIVQSLGAISVANLDSWRNIYGALLQNHGFGVVGSPTSAVTLTGNASTGENDYYGLWVRSKGQILMSLTDAWVPNNGTYGWYLKNTYGTAGVTLNVTYGNNIDFWDNGSYGLLVESNGSILAVNVDAGRNGWDVGGWGVMLDNHNGTGVVTLTTPISSNRFEANYGDGLVVLSRGAITLNNLYILDNQGYGAWLDNSYSLGLPQNITISGYGTFNNNGDDGLRAYSYGQVTLTNISASDNGWQGDPGTGWGAYLDNCFWDDINSVCATDFPKGITLLGSNTFNSNPQDGLFANSSGPIKANNLYAEGNFLDGAYLDNWSNLTNQVLILTGTNTFNWNGFGLEAWSNGNISISNLNASYNDGGGAYLETYSNLVYPSSVTLSGSNSFWFNTDGDNMTGPENGLEVYADGNITINNLLSNFNSGSGAILDNSIGWYSYPYLGTVPTLKLTGVNTFYGNDIYGLAFDIAGAVTITKILADMNGEDGLDGYSDGNITITCGSMTNNGVYGWVLGGNIVTLNGVFAYGNLSGTNQVEDGGTFYYFRTCPLP